MFQAILAIPLMPILQFELATLILTKLIQKERSMKIEGGHPMQSAEQEMSVSWDWGTWERKDEVEELQH